MTSPVERLRSLQWGAELLESVIADASLEAGLRFRAQEVLQHYPYEQLVVSLTDPAMAVIPTEFEQRLDEARNLFEIIRSGTAIPAELRNHATYCLRHFPTPGSARWTSRPGAERLLPQWLELPPRPQGSDNF